MSDRATDAVTTDEPVLAARDGYVLQLTLNRPDRLNAVSRPLYERLVEELEGADGDTDVRCVLLTGAGRAFCAGADLKAHAEGPPDEFERARYIDAAQRANELVQRIGKPVVAAVNGAAVGAGLELALSSDLIIVADGAKLRLPEVALGTFIGGGVAYTLVERVGIAKARELVYFGDFFSGADAAAMGLVNRSVPAEEVLTVAREWAGRLAERAPRSLAAAKRLIGPASDRTRADVLEAERAALDEIFGTEDWAEGIAAHREGRPPRYTGR
ncbi:MAG: enoyl-CoA hydratase/isomerase family protein [Gemmatimonadetes bacterium]|nr:enoyl-CoA hydratase/isomerase family protein [Gemmatimonadota bacterium]